MNRQKISLISATVSIVLGLEALLVVLLLRIRGLADEGSAADIFQILSVAQTPFLLAFLATADWKRVWTRYIVTLICLALVYSAIEESLITPVVKHFGLSDEAKMYVWWGGMMVFLIVSSKLMARSHTIDRHLRNQPNPN